MTVTRFAIGAGVVIVGFLCWMAAIGFTAVIGPLVTVVVLILLVGGGNWLSGERGSGSSRGSGGPR
jgi:hypothetical protein